MKTFMKLASLVLLFAAISSLHSCLSDNCVEVITYKAYVPQYTSIGIIRSGVAVSAPTELKALGKIYKKGDYLFINELDKGIHIYDNSNPSNPVNLSFLAIPGNVDIAIIGNTLYADSYIDLLVFDINAISSPSLIKRLKSVLPQRTRENSIATDDAAGIVTSFVEEEITETIDCNVDRTRFFVQEDILASSPSSGSNGPQLTGLAGSLARFSIVGKALYALNTTSLKAFDITDSKDPVLIKDVPIGFNIETIFPYNGYLFIGSETGLFIYNANNPFSPFYVSQFNHARGCDPVVVENNKAYVTVRSRATRCQGELNQLDVIDVTTIANPQKLKSFPMYNPHGVGIDNSTLFICDEAEGLKIFDASDPIRIDQNLITRKRIDAIDVIPDNGELIVIAKDGIYQYDYSNLSDIKLLSSILVSP